jgi:hypothetical protein
MSELATLEAPPAKRIPPARTMWVILALVLIADALDLIDATITSPARSCSAARCSGSSTA